MTFRELVEQMQIQESRKIKIGKRKAVKVSKNDTGYLAKMARAT